MSTKGITVRRTWQTEFCGLKVCSEGGRVEVNDYGGESPKTWFFDNWHAEHSDVPYPHTARVMRVRGWANDGNEGAIRPGSDYDSTPVPKGDYFEERDLESWYSCPMCPSDVIGR